jgi:hypothetical protein
VKNAKDKLKGAHPGYFVIPLRRKLQGRRSRQNHRLHVFAANPVENDSTKYLCVFLTIKA